jgi:hypothetical protein
MQSSSHRTPHPKQTHTASGSGASPANSSDSAASSERSLDSAEARAQAAAARLRDFGESVGGGGNGGNSDGPKKLALPSALDAFDEVGGPPAFLDPEATRKLPTALLTGRQGDAAAAAAAGAGSSRQQQPGPDADISRLAPKLKGADEGRRGPPVIEGKAKRYRDDDGDGQTYTAAQIAMLGGHVPSGGGGGADGGEAAAAKRAPGPSAVPGPAPQQNEQQQQRRSKPTPAMGVQDFMDKGLGGAQLPRKRQDRKEKEQAKRAKGQSTHAEWKPEAWMVMRQQYD